MTNSMKTSAQNASERQSAQANTNALASMNNAATNSKIEQSMKEYGTYTATSDANNEYPPKNQANGYMNTTSLALASASVFANNSSAISGNERLSEE